MTALLLLIICLLLGALVSRIASPPPSLAASLNWWVLNIALPALVLSHIPTLHLHWSLWYLPVSMWLVFLGAWAFFALLGHLLHWSRARIGALTLVCGLGNTSFIGYPMLEALRGQEGLALGVIADQLGSFVMLAVGGAIITAVYSGARVRTGQIVRRVLLFPAFIAMLIGFVVGALDGWPTWMDAILSRLGSTLVPLALFSVGLQIRFSLVAGETAALITGLSWKLLLAPLFIYALGILLGVSGITLTISVLQAAMAPMISAAILAEQHQLEPRLANLILTVGIVASLVTAPLANSWL